MYRVIKFFTDMQDNNHAYNVGDEFPHDGMEVTEKRLLELSTSANRRGMPLIEQVNEAGEPVQIEAETEEPIDDFMNPPEEPIEEEDTEKPKKRRGRPRKEVN